MFKRALFIPSICLLSATSLQAQQWFTPNALSQDSLTLGNVSWGDYDSDGDQDLLANGVNFSNEQETILYQNQGGTFTAVSVPFDSVQNGISEFVDLDNDNDLDVFLSGFSPSGAITRTYLNTNGTFQQVDLGIEDVQFTETAWIDVDHDGDQDLILSGWDASFTGNTRLYINHIDSFVVDTNAQFPVVNFATVDASDVDGDGMVDIILAGQDGSYSAYSEIFEYDYINRTLTAQPYSIAPVSSPWAEFFDYDQDGDEDLFLMGNDTAYAERIFVYENDGTTLVETQSLDSLASGFSKNPMIIGDIDNNGAADVVVAGYDDDYNYMILAYTSNQGVYSWASQAGLPMYGGNSSLAFYDVDGDLDLDFVHAGTDDATIDAFALQLYINDSAATNTAPAAPSALMSYVDGDSVQLTWTKGSDAQTGTDGLTYNLGIYYTTGNEWILAPKTLASGVRMVTERGNKLGDTTVAYTGLTPGVYHWQILSIDNAYTPSSLLVDSFVISDLTAFNLVSPAHQTMLSIIPNSDETEFTWGSSANALSYSFKFYDNAYQELFVEESNSNGADTMFTIDHEDLYEECHDAGQASGTTETYYWVAYAFGQYDSLVSTDTFAIDIELIQYPMAFDLVAPTDGDTIEVDKVGSDEIAFTWNESEGVDDEYELRFTESIDAGFSQMIINESTSDTTWSMDEGDLFEELEQAGQDVETVAAYIWQVEAEGEFDNTVSNETRTVYVKLIDSSVGVGELASTFVTVMPSPFSNEFTIVNNGDAPIENIRVVNVLGEEVQQIQKIETQSRVYVSSTEWSSGVYVLSYSVNGEQITQQLIKQ